MIQNFVSDTEKFTLDGVSSDTLGLYCDYLPPVPMAEQLYTTFNVGADEMGTTPDDVFNDIRYQIRFYTFMPDNFNDVEIKAFCQGKSILTLSRCPDYYFKIRRMSLSVGDSIGYGKRIDYVLTLTLAPFRYVTDNEWIDITATKAQSTIYNLHSRYSKPTIQITGTGAIEVLCQDVSFQVTGLDTNQTVVIDSTRQITYSGSNLWTYKTEGSYPLLNVGTNILSFIGTISEVLIKMNWRDF